MKVNLKHDWEWPFSVALPFWATPEGADDAIETTNLGGRVEFQRGDAVLNVGIAECDVDVCLNEIGKRPLVARIWDIAFFDEARGLSWTAGFRGTPAQVGQAAARALASGSPPRARLWLLEGC